LIDVHYQDDSQSKMYDNILKSCLTIIYFKIVYYLSFSGDYEYYNKYLNDEIRLEDDDSTSKINAENNNLK